MKPELRDALKLYLVTDPVLHGGRGVSATCREALIAGVRFVQLRDKNASTQSLLNSAMELRDLCAGYSSYFVVNDRIDVAMAAGADGVHLGQSDMPLDTARSLMGPEAIIGVSVRTVEEAQKAFEQGANYIAANLVFPTRTKKDVKEPLGLDMVSILSEASSLPLIAIGGINPENTALVMNAGCAGVAVVTAVMNADSPSSAVEKFLNILNRQTNSPAVFE
ncbi:MAG: thiamine phosphate synthase [Candidatus Sabulitectum sp.]|nr:thiamine phosphate synthase [Candidatus Sabulitectum sp.]